ncbi:hypothetical protein [Desnuesiella massiliensis]|uniref:hypothetical protein n=1 Tax=Desnuesiella massiliensis TaxID=1650662 RepID=UPI0006E32538|nr:hypothetical protein [Desnuesiella massiliensis]
MKTNLETVLLKIAKLLNQENILWGVGDSMLLWCYELVEEYNKISIIIAEKDIRKVNMLLSDLGIRTQKEKICFYDSAFFQQYQTEGIIIDVISGPIIYSHGKVYRYSFDEKSIPHYTRICGENIPLTTLEEWYILYSMMPQGESRAKLIENFFENIGVIYPEVLQRMLKDELPKDVMKKCGSMLKIS